jgi:hypothetical protein
MNRDGRCASLRLLGLVRRVGNDGACPSFLVLLSPGLISKQHSGEPNLAVLGCVRYATTEHHCAVLRPPLVVPHLFTCTQHRVSQAVLRCDWPAVSTRGLRKAASTGYVLEANFFSRLA